MSNAEVSKKSMKTILISGIPDEFTLSDISDFVDYQFDAETAYIELRKNNRFKFRGSIIVVPSTRDEVDRLLNESFSCEQQPLEIKEVTDIAIHPVRVRSERKKKNSVGKRTTEKRSEKKSTEKNSTEKKDVEKKNSEEIKVKTKKIERKKDAILHFTGKKEESRFSEFKKVFGEYEKVAWVSFKRNGTEGYVRFSEDGGAQKVIEIANEKSDGKVVVDDAELELRVVSGDEEEEFWEKTEREIASKRRRWYGRWNGKRRYNPRRKQWQKKENNEEAGNGHEREDNSEGDVDDDKRSELTDSSPEKITYVEQVE